MNSTRKRVVIVVVILLAVVIVLTPMALLIQGKEDARQQELHLAFVARYGTEAKLLQIVEPEGLYVYIWETDEGGVQLIRYTMAIDGLFVELGQTLAEE